MRTMTLFFIAGLFASPLCANTDTLLYDDFSSPTIDLSKWTTILPTASSALIQEDGFLCTMGRGILGTADSYTQPLIISGDFTLTNDAEHFNIALRTNLAAGPSYERTGVIVSFSNDGKDVSVQEVGADSLTTLVDRYYYMETGGSYHFSIVDTGDAISVNVNGFDLLYADTTYSTGGQAAFYSRELRDYSGTDISDVEIDYNPDAVAVHSTPPFGVPDGGGLSLYVGLLGLLGIKRLLR